MKLNFYDFGKNRVLEAKYIGRYPSVGAFKKAVHSFRDKKKKVFHAWGSAMLNHLLFGIPFGSEVKITYKGKFKTDESRYPLHQFEVEVTKIVE
jgi:hypothetical protein